MGRAKKYKGEDPFIREDSFTTDDGKLISNGDIVKVRGIWGSKFRFLNYVTNPKTNVSWVDCIQLEKGIGCGYRSFYPERIKHIPKKRGKRGPRSRQAS